MIRAPYERIGRDEVFAWWDASFGGGLAQFAGLSCFRRGRPTVWVAADSVVLAGLADVDGVGIPFVRVGGHDWKPTTVAALRFGSTATRNVVEVTRAEAVALVARRPVEVSSADPRQPLPVGGYGIARYAGVPVGCIQWRAGKLESCIPKGRAFADLDLLEVER